MTPHQIAQNLTSFMQAHPINEGEFREEVKALYSIESDLQILREKLNYERRVNGILADKLAAAEYDLNHYKSLLKKALEK